MESDPMSSTSGSAFSVSALFAERDARKQRDRDADEQLKRKHQEELADFRKRLDQFQLTDERVALVHDQIRHAFERGESELLLTSFPSDFCSDSGRAITNADAPAINKSPLGADQEPAWLVTLPAGARVVYDYWKTNLKPGGFGLSARIVNYKDGIPGDVGLFFTWPRSALDAQS
jgi:hypothetical protein